MKRRAIAQTAPFCLKGFVFRSSFGEQYPREFISRREALKLHEDEAEVRIAAVDGGGPELREYLAGYHLPKRVRFFPVSKVEFASYMGELAAGEGGEEAAPDPAGNGFALEAASGDAPVVSIINGICLEALKLDASDIHIEAGEGAVRIRYRIDGVLRPVKRLDLSFFSAISNRIKIMADMNPLERRLPQDGRMTVSAGGDAVDLRVSVIPLSDGESIVLRIFQRSARALGPEELGFYPPDLEKIRNCLHQPWGLLLLTGPTGSGKTTTLHALLGCLPVNEMKIIALEDPVEELIPGINQVQINEAIKLSFDTMLRRVLRQDPNVILVGEIRDNPTAELALRAALTGHLILSTLHTNDSVSVIPRLRNMGIEPYLLGAVLRCSVAQRLVRKLCPLCAKKTGASRRLKALLEKYRLGGNSMFEPAGCAACGGSGYRGRTVVGEVFTVDETLGDLIAQGKGTAELQAHAQSRGMETAARDALRKVLRGLTSLEEAERELLL